MPETRALIREIEKKDRRFRLALSFFMVVTILGLTGIVAAQLRTLSAVQQQLAQQKKTVAEIKKDNKEQLDRLNKHLDCIVIYFGQPDRRQLTIDDINQCTLSNEDGAQQYFSHANTTTQPSPPPEQAVVPSEEGPPRASADGTSKDDNPVPPESKSIVNALTETLGSILQLGGAIR